MSAATAKYGILRWRRRINNRRAVAWAAREAVMRQRHHPAAHYLPLWLSAGRWASWYANMMTEWQRTTHSRSVSQA